MNRNFKKSLVALAAVASASIFTNAYALDEAFAKHSCTGCHQVEKKLVGPAYKDVATKYAAQKDAEAYLSKKIKEGSTGVWGPIPMPANAAVTDDEMKKIVKEILALKGK